MDVALIEHAENDVDGHEGRENQERLVGERVLKHFCRALKSAANGRRHAEPVHGGFDGRDPIAQRNARREVERDGVGDEQALVIDRKRRRPLAEFGDRRQRDHGLLSGRDRRAGRCHALARGPDRIGGLIARGLRVGGGCGRRRALGYDGARHRIGRLGAADRAAGGRDIDVLQRLRILPVARRHLHDDVVLVARDIDGRDLALAEGVVERVVDLAHGDAEPRRGVTIDDDV